jgi:archaellin
MKIRIRGNSIRYRLDKKDIEILQVEQQVSETTTIGPASLHFTITAGSASITLEQNTLTLYVPAQQLKTWILTEQVGFSLELPNPDNTQLQILVEKDFKCLTERNEDETMAFENPSKSC